MAATPWLRLCGECEKFYEELAEQLFEFAEHVFRNSRKLSDGATQGDHQDSAARQWAKMGKRKAAEQAAPAGPELPHCLYYLWAHFCEVLMGLPQNGMVEPAVTWEALRAWRAETLMHLEPWEARALVRLGALRASILAETAPTGASK